MRIGLTGKAIAMTLAVLMIITPLLAQQQASDYVQGKLDGERDATGSALWILAGVGCGCFGVLGAYVFRPSPPAERLIGKTADYVIGYRDGYKGKSANRNALYAAGGWLAFVVVYYSIVLSSR
jgi:hypothetical protein